MVVRAGKWRQRTKNWCLQTVVLEKTPERPLDSKEIKPVNPKADQPWIFTARSDAEAEAPVFWSSDANKTHWKIPWCWERSRAEGVEGITSAMNTNSGKLQEMVRDKEAWHATVHGVATSRTWLADSNSSNNLLKCWIPMSYNWNRCNMVNQPYFNKKEEKYGTVIEIVQMLIVLTQ